MTAQILLEGLIWRYPVILFARKHTQLFYFAGDSGEGGGGETEREGRTVNLSPGKVGFFCNARHGVFGYWEDQSEAHPFRALCSRGVFFVVSAFFFYSPFKTTEKSEMKLGEVEVWEALMCFARNTAKKKGGKKRKGKKRPEK